ncbi:hypothetical protein KBTX_03444 [wastewater metagenome]|uniref:Uncharacterized protein n=3 Tax=root TaxID=1 RepID=A0A5B8RDI8_9ZZZZ|nr:hypothetical protein KBTEX_03444 [uncultured organism]
MRTITADDGRSWTAFVGRESYGVHMVLFMPQSGGGACQVPLASATWLEAERELGSMTDEELLRCLNERSWPWGEGFDGSTP